MCFSKPKDQNAKLKSAHREGKLTVETLRHMLQRLITDKDLAIQDLPAATTSPFLSYTDFLAIFVAFLASGTPGSFRLKQIR